MSNRSTSEPHAVLRTRRQEASVIAGDVFTLEWGIPSRGSGPDGSRPVFSVLGYEDALTTLHDPLTFSSRIRAEGPSRYTGMKNVSAMDGEEHRFWRGLLQPVLGRKALRHWRESVITPVAAAGLEDFAEQRTFDLQEYAHRFPIMVIYRVLGISDDLEIQRHFAKLADTTQLARPDRNSSPKQAGKAAAAAARELLDLIAPVVAERRASDSDEQDLISQLVRAEFEGRSLDDDEITNFVGSLLPAAAHTTTRTFASLMTHCLNRRLLEKLVSDRSLIATAVNETLRFDPPGMALQRISNADVTLGGVDIPEGSGIIAVVGAANRDDAAFTDPDEYDITRDERSHLAFGWGSHLCIGMHIARLELEIGLNLLFDKFPDMRLDASHAAPEVSGILERSAGAIHVQVG